MSLRETLSLGFQSLINKAGTPIVVQYFTKTIGSVWDDETTLISAGSIFTSGIIIPLSNQDGILVEQGLLQPNDQKIYLHGSLILTGSIYETRIGIGPSNQDWFSLIPTGKQYTVQNTPIYKVMFIRRLTGSYLGE